MSLGPQLRKDAENSRTECNRHAGGVYETVMLLRLRFCLLSLDWKMSVDFKTYSNDFTKSQSCLKTMAKETTPVKLGYSLEFDEAGGR